MLTKTMTLFSATLLLAACNSTAQPKPAAPAQSAPAAQSATAAPIRQAWHLTELSGFKGEIPANAKMDWSKLPTAYAYMGCNHMNFQAQPENGRHHRHRHAVRKQSAGRCVRHRHEARVAL